MHRPLLFVLVALAAAGCAGTPTPDLTPRTRDATPATASAPERVQPRQDSLRPRGDGSARLVPAARIGDDRIAECSGLAYAGGYWWMHNDSGDGPFLFRSRSPWFETAERVEVEGAKAIDWEEIAALDGDILICDIGDNERARTDATIYRVRPTADGVDLVATYPIAYPDGKHDAEAVWVWGGRVHIVLKNRGEDEHTVYRFGELRDSVPNVPKRIGAVAIPPGEQVTAADSNADGYVALLTYSQLLVWPADAVRGRPSQAFTLHARQCEALAWTDTGIVIANEQRDVYFIDKPLECGLDPWLPLADSARLAHVPNGADGRPALDLLADVPVRNLRVGEFVRMGRARDRIVIHMRFETEAEILPSTDRLGTSVLMAFGNDDRLRVTPDVAQIAIVLAPVERIGAVAMDLGGGQSSVDAESITVAGAEENGTVSLVVEIPVATLFPGGMPREFRMGLVGNGLRTGDDEPLFGALDGFSLQRPYAWATITTQ